MTSRLVTVVRPVRQPPQPSISARGCTSPPPHRIQAIFGKAKEALSERVKDPRTLELYGHLYVPKPPMAPDTPDVTSKVILDAVRDPYPKTR